MQVYNIVFEINLIQNDKFVDLITNLGPINRMESNTKVGLITYTYRRRNQNVMLQ